MTLTRIVATPQDTRRRSWVRTHVIPVAAVILTVVGAWAVALGQSGPGVTPFSQEAIGRIVDFLARVTETGNQTNALSDAASWRRALTLAGDTIVMSVLAAGLAGIGALVTLPFALRSDRADPRRTPLRAVMAGAVRVTYTITRAVPELVWAFLVVFVLQPGIVPGAIALAIHNFGVLGRLSVDLTENTPSRPLAALGATGASPSQVFAYGAFPQILPGFITFLLFRWEVIIRTTVVVGFVVGAGLGYQLRLDLSFFRYADIAVLLLTYLAIVLAVDALSSALRRLSN